jgi:folate-binding protein YgfZ
MFLFSEDVKIENLHNSLFTYYVSTQSEEKSSELSELIDGLQKENVESITIPYSFLGNSGFYLFSSNEKDLENIEKLLSKHHLAQIESELFFKDLEATRIESGILNRGVDYTPGKTLLPETALEAELVSYSKGCYLGQEVIARTKTYGSTPFALRGLAFEGTQHQDILSEIDKPGSDIFQLTEENPDGVKVGRILSRTVSPTLDKVIAYAYLSRESRTPGNEIVIKGKTMPIIAEVTLLPFVGSRDSKEKAKVLFDQAVKLYADGEDEKAINLMEDILRLDPSFNDAYETLGVMLGKSEKYHEAIEIFRRLEEIAPSEPLVNTNLSLYLMKIGDKDGAEKEATKATLKSFSKASDEFSAKELEKQQKEMEQNAARRKKEMFEEVLEFDPVDPIALFGLGNVLITLGDFEKAEANLSKAVEVDPKNSAVYLSLGKVLEKNQKAAQAKEIYEKGIKEASIKGDLMPLKEMENRLMMLRRRK